MFYEPKNGHGLPHDPFKAIVSPRPIGWISTISRTGEVNLAPYSFFNAFSTQSLSRLVFVGGAEGQRQPSRQETGEFVANLVGRDLAEQDEPHVGRLRRVASANSTYAGLTEAPSRLVRRRAWPRRRPRSNAR